MESIVSGVRVTRVMFRLGTHEIRRVTNAVGILRVSGHKASSS